MGADIVQRYGPGMSFYRSQIKPSRPKIRPEDAALKVCEWTYGRGAKLYAGWSKFAGHADMVSYQEYCAALRELTITNKLLENKVKQLCSESVRLNLDVTILKKYMSDFHGELLVTWQADILTRLVEVIYERHGWRMPGEILVGDHDNLDRDTLSKIYVMAAKKIKKETVTKKAVGLSEPYYLALQRFDKYESFSNGIQFCPMADVGKINTARDVSFLGEAVSCVLSSDCPGEL